MHKKIFMAFCFALTVLLQTQSDVLAAPNVPVPIQCSKSSFSGVKLAELVHAIAVHGDLTDVPFIEKTLQVKFKSQYAIEAYGVNKKRMVYEADAIFDAPIHVGLGVNLDPDKQIEYYWIGSLSFSGPYVHDCLRLSSLDFERAFEFGLDRHTIIEPLDSMRYARRGIIRPPDTVTDMTKKLPAKDGSIMRVAASYNNDTDDNIIDRISLGQMPGVSIHQHQ